MDWPGPRCEGIAKRPPGSSPFRIHESILMGMVNGTDRRAPHHAPESLRAALPVDRCADVYARSEAVTKPRMQPPRVLLRPTL